MNLQLFHLLPVDGATYNPFWSNSALSSFDAFCVEQGANRVHKVLYDAQIATNHLLFYFTAVHILLIWAF